MFKKFLKQQIVVDVIGQIVYLGTLSKIEDDFIELKEVDVHDINDSNSTKEIYLQKILITGIIPNRNKCLILKDKILSFSLFKDIKKYL